MSKANRSRRPARPNPFRNAKKRILVVCEGSTEKEYVDGYVMSLRNSLVVSVEAVGNAGVPMTVVEMAKELKSSNAEQALVEKDSNVSFDSVWVMFDVDEHPRVDDAKIMARDNGIGVAVSNPCIELWLYLHFADSPGMQDRHRMLRLLRDKIPGYTKHVQFTEFVAQVDIAKQRAHRLDEQADLDKESGRNPTTSIWKLLEDILRS
jgi:RloB-like protein